MKLDRFYHVEYSLSEIIRTLQVQSQLQVINKKYLLELNTGTRRGLTKLEQSPRYAIKQRNQIKPNLTLLPGWLFDDLKKVTISID